MFDFVRWTNCIELFRSIKFDGSLFDFLRCGTPGLFASVTSLTQPGRNSCPRLQPYLIGSCRVGVSQSQLFYVHLWRSTSVPNSKFCIFSNSDWILRNHESIPVLLIEGPTLSDSEEIVNRLRHLNKKSVNAT